MPPTTQAPPTGQLNAQGDRVGATFLLDGMSLAFRAYFALPATLSTTSGVVTNAVHGFVSMVQFIIREHQPGSLAVAFDLPGETFRDEMIADYKAGRAEAPKDLPPQFEMIREVMHALAIPVVEAPGYEADDVLATLATEARDRGCDVVVVTGDRDSFQLIEDPHMRVLYNRRGVSDYSLYDEAGILERCGVPPSKYVMLAALRGDPSDNLPGIPGVGEKTAAKLLNAYGDLDGVFAHVAEQTPKLRENLANNEELARSNATVIPLGARRAAGGTRRSAPTRRVGPEDGRGRIRQVRTADALAAGRGAPGGRRPGRGRRRQRGTVRLGHRAHQGRQGEPGHLAERYRGLRPGRRTGPGRWTGSPARPVRPERCGPSWSTSARCACRRRPGRRPPIWRRWPGGPAAWSPAGPAPPAAAR